MQLNTGAGNLDELISKEGDGSSCFQKTFITQGMANLASGGVARLAGASF